MQWKSQWHIEMSLANSSCVRFAPGYNCWLSSLCPLSEREGNLERITVKLPICFQWLRIRIMHGCSTSWFSNSLHSVWRADGMLGSKRNFRLRPLFVVEVVLTYIKLFLSSEEKQARTNASHLGASFLFFYSHPPWRVIFPSTRQQKPHLSVHKILGADWVRKSTEEPLDAWLWACCFPLCLCYALSDPVVLIWKHSWWSAALQSRRSATEKTTPEIQKVGENQAKRWNKCCICLRCIFALGLLSQKPFPEILLMYANFARWR